MTPNDEGVFGGSAPPAGIPRVSAVQTYLDLKGHPERARREYVELVRAGALYLATLFGDLPDATVVVGGLVPTLLIPQDDLAPGTEAHVGTMDLDLGLELALLEGERYSMLAERLRQAGFTPDRNERGNPTPQR